ncbi:hypothetical protein SERLA73DRAFT_149373 [Serpula lacrymans var. lacrymans S7.3]|uniref:Uncharacterized protein n=2 Tax=Serpula lacrymans var. lacrymans TaxID=341189 RepID=F8PIA4_SERL3|nr:uncharacterized protein SERLADRAFT_404864 [Serpula lacrymans var. lacrymans S7.9]EGO05147.1 hypothetical protein SERLA73DRAFT_149373 [Serpula lacrymans var. lacrymans S7.3]EGO30892.1 hypothetical protein SERLADRAFT_404864 [Serpula lacrymans var. lacrymans S7.9]
MATLFSITKTFNITLVVCQCVFHIFIFGSPENAIVLVSRDLFWVFGNSAIDKVSKQHADPATSIDWYNDRLITILQLMSIQTQAMDFGVGITVGLAMSVANKMRMSESLAAATEVDISCSAFNKNYGPPDLLPVDDKCDKGSSIQLGLETHHDGVTDFTFYTTMYTNKAHAAI